jgi:hypothetical protein
VKEKKGKQQRGEERRGEERRTREGKKESLKANTRGLPARRPRLNF